MSNVLTTKATDVREANRGRLELLRRQNYYMLDCEHGLEGMQGKVSRAVFGAQKKIPTPRRLDLKGAPADQ